LLLFLFTISATIKQNVFTPKKKDKKKKLPIERDGIKPENPEKYYEFGEEIGRYTIIIFVAIPYSIR